MQLTTFPSPGTNATNTRGIGAGLSPSGRGETYRTVILPRPLGADRYAQVHCHSERSEESLSFFAGFVLGAEKRDSSPATEGWPGVGSREIN